MPRSTGSFSSLPTGCAAVLRARDRGLPRGDRRACEPAAGRARRRRVRPRSGVERVHPLSGRMRQPHPGQRRAAADRRSRARSGVSRGLSRPPHDRQPPRRALRRPAVELLVQPLFSPQSLLHEAASSLAGALAFPDRRESRSSATSCFRWPASIPPTADRHVRVGRLVDRLHGVAGRHRAPVSRRRARLSARGRGARARRADAVGRRHAEISEPVPHATRRPTRSAGTRCRDTSTPSSTAGEASRWRAYIRCRHRTRRKSCRRSRRRGK